MALAALAAFSTSCVEEKEECEKNNTGEIKVVNSSAVSIEVDVTTTPDGTNDETTLQSNMSQIYTVTAGVDAYIYARTLASPYWYMIATETATQCMSKTYTIDNIDCIINNTGEITVVNDNPFTIRVDVVNADHPISTGIRTLAANESTTYTVTAGLPTTIQVLPEGWTWTNVDIRTANQCQTVSYSWAYCNYDGNNYAKEIKSTNETGSRTVVDVWSVEAGDYMGEVVLENNESAFHYNVPAGDFKYYIRYSNSDQHNLSDTYTVARCATHSMTWSAGKVAAGNKSNEMKQATPYVPFKAFGTPSIKK